MGWGARGFRDASICPIPDFPCGRGGFELMARTLDLRTGRPVWLAYRAPAVPVRKLTRDVKTDVLIVGMGISGGMVAEALSAVGLSVMMIDRRGPMLGSTAATTALVQFEIDTPLSRLRTQIGADKAERAWQRSRLAVINLKGRLETLGISCALAPRPTLYLAGNTLSGSALRKEAELRRAAGLYADYLGPKALAEGFGIDRAGAILSRDNLELDPRKMTAGLILAAMARGARLYAPAQARRIVHEADGVTVETDGGPTIRADQVVLATGYELTDIAPTGGHSIISTWAIATRPQPENLWPGRGLIWEASDPYLYLRATRDGRIVCGGEDAEFSDETQRDALIPEKSAAIAAKLATLLPRIDVTPHFAWAGSFGTTASGLPLIGALPGKPRIHALMGYGGNGITFARLGAEIIAATIAGKTATDADLFAFGAR